MQTLIFWNNPIFQRELLGRLRSWKTLGAVLLVSAATSLLVILRWPTDQTIDIVSQESLLVFRPLASTLVLAMMLLVPSFPSTSLVGERRKGTLGLLLNSPMSALSIYWGKILSNVLLATVIASVSLPALGACYAMGGISFSKQMLPLLIILVSMAIQYSALGLYVSARSSSTDASLRWTYAAVLTLTVLSVAPLVLVGNTVGAFGWISKILSALSPIAALRQITASQGLTSALGLQTGWVEYLGASIALTGVLGWLTIQRLNPLSHDRARPTGAIAGETKQGGWLRRILFLIDPARRKAGIPRILNPVMVKEFRTRKFGRLHWLIRLIAVCAIASLLITVLASQGTVTWGIDRIAGPMVLLQMALLLLVGPALGAGLIAAEVESGGWQILRVTPISAIRILFGKLMSAIITLSLVLLATLPGYITMSYIQPAMVGQVNNVLCSLLVAVALVISISALISSLARTSAVATTTSYAVLLTLFIGTLIVWLARGRPFGAFFVEKVLLFNPIAAALSEMKTPGFETYNLIPGCWWIGLAIAGVCFILTACRVLWMVKPD